MNIADLLPKDKCPICDVKTTCALDTDILDIWCLNQCYTLSIDWDIFEVDLFNGKEKEDRFVFNKKQESLEELVRLEERIAYWKENYRYLAEILVRR